MTESPFENLAFLSRVNTHVTGSVCFHDWATAGTISPAVVVAVDPQVGHRQFHKHPLIHQRRVESFVLGTDVSDHLLFRMELHVVRVRLMGASSAPQSSCTSPNLSSRSVFAFSNTRLAMGFVKVRCALVGLLDKSVDRWRTGNEIPQILRSYMGGLLLLIGCAKTGR